MEDSGQLSLERNKLELYRFLIKNGFEPIQNEKLRESYLSQFTEDQIKNFLDTYKTIPCQSFLKLWIYKLIESKSGKIDGIHQLFSDVLKRKAYTFPENNDYRQVYLLLAQILQGEMPDISQLSERSTKILLILIEDLRLKAHSIGMKNFQEILSPETEEENITSPDDDDPGEQILKTLLKLFKFQKIADFMNPFNIPLDANKKLMDQIRLNSPEE